MFKPIELTARTSFVSTMDPAIDWDRMIDEMLAEEKHKALREDQDMGEEEKRNLVKGMIMAQLVDAIRKHPTSGESLLRFTDNEQPTRFVLGVIQSADLNRIEDECQNKFAEMRWRAFLASVVEIENWQGKVEKNGENRIDPEWAHKTFTKGLRRVALEVGNVALKWNSLTEDEIKK
jgi:hypothetical protein